MQQHSSRRHATSILIAAAVTILLGVSASTFAEGGLPGFEVGQEAEIEGLPRVVQELVAPPFLPQHDQVAKGGAKIVEVTLDVVEKEMEIAPGVFVQAMTFNGTNPGPIIVVHEGDYVELTLRNPKSNTMPHNIDFHASTGAMGGGALTLVGPGQQVKLRWKATKTGTFIYHCAPGGAMIPYHVVAGMNGAVLVLPRDGLTDAEGEPVRYDGAYYIGEQDFYIPKDGEGNFKRYGNPTAALNDSLEAMKTLVPTHITFNGRVGGLTGDHAMKASVGESVLFIHSQANRDSRVHIIGGHGDLVWHGGSFSDAPDTNRETWPVFGGEAAAALYTFRQPGIYAYVNHNLIEAVLLGAVGHISVDGQWNNDLMEQVAAPHPIE